MTKAIKVRTSARKAALASTLANVGVAAMREGESFANVIAATRNALGSIRPDSKDPADKARFAEVRHTYQTGRMAFTLFARSNLPDAERLAKARLARDAADGEGKGILKAGQTRRRTKAEQAAYDAAKTAWSRLLRAAGLVTIENRGGNVTPKANKTGDKTGDKGKTPVKGAQASAADLAKYMPPKSADKETAVAYVRQQIKLIATFIAASNQRLMKTSDETFPIAISGPITDCLKAIEAIK